MLRNFGNSFEATENPTLCRLLLENWDQLEAEVLADGEYDPEELVSFLKISLPMYLRDKLSNQPEFASLVKSPLFQYKIGSREAFEKVKRVKSE